MSITCAIPKSNTKISCAFVANENKAKKIISCFRFPAWQFQVNQAGRHFIFFSIFFYQKSMRQCIFFCLKTNEQKHIYPLPGHGGNFYPPKKGFHNNFCLGVILKKSDRDKKVMGVLQFLSHVR